MWEKTPPVNALAHVGKRVVFRKPNMVEIEEFEIPPPGPGEVLIRTISSLISPGTETAFLQALPNTPKHFPQYPGYSNAGIVIDVGEGVKGLKKGDRVVSPAQHASVVVMKDTLAYKIPKGISFDEASFFNLISIALQGVRRALLGIGESVLVLGLGLVGQLALQLSRLNGAIPLIGVDLYDYRLDVAKRLGADYVINPRRDDLISEVMKLTEGKGVDVVIEATGNPECIPIAFKLAGTCGRVILLGSTRGSNTINFYSEVHRKGLFIIGAHNSARPTHESHKLFWTKHDDCLLALRLIASKRVNVNELISLRMSYRRAPEAYEKLIKAKNEVLGIILKWEDA